MTQLLLLLSWVCEESGQVNLDAMRADISTAFMTSDFDWRSAILTCEAVKFPMLCSLTERVQEDLDSEFERISLCTIWKRNSTSSVFTFTS